MAAILSIQSHVCYGYVGNRAAVFPLQRLGHDVHVINTVQFSNHTGYGQWEGMIFTADHIRALVHGLHQRHALQNCQAVLTGYMGDYTIGKEILSVVDQCRNARSIDAQTTDNRKFTYLCDPVIGDIDRGIFVKPEIPEFFRQYLLPVADILTPNHFEAEILTQQSIRSHKDAIAACRIMNPAGDKIIIITSLKHNDTPTGSIETFFQCADGFFYIITPEISFATPPNGTGDFFSALFLGHFLQHRAPQTALEQAVATTFSVLQKTHEQQVRELEIIASQDIIAHPETLFKCQKVFA